MIQINPIFTLLARSLLLVSFLFSSLQTTSQTIYQLHLLTLNPPPQLSTNLFPMISYWNLHMYLPICLPSFLSHLSLLFLNLFIFSQENELSLLHHFWSWKFSWPLAVFLGHSLLEYSVLQLILLFIDHNLHADLQKKLNREISLINSLKSIILSIRYWH